MSLMFPDHRSQVDSIIAAVREQSDPRIRTAAAVRENPPVGGRLAVIAVGKAAPSMFEGFRDAWPGVRNAIMVVPEGVPAPFWANRADHPVPTSRCLSVARRIAEYVEDMAALGYDGFVLLLSGGASSLLTWPIANLDIDEYAAAVKSMLGLDIVRLNTIRKHCERLKGGRLALLMSPLPCTNYVLSDVIGDDLSTIGSGPTVPDPTTIDDALEPFERDLKFTDAERVLLPLLQKSTDRSVETPKPGDPAFTRVRSVVVGSNALAVDAAQSRASDLGFAVTVHKGVVGDAQWAGRELAREIIGLSRPACLVFGGETVVTTDQRSGKGGRNQELALAAAIEIDRTPNLAVATFATDGVDGPTDAAGAIVTDQTCELARRLGLDPPAALANHDSYSFFDALDKGGFPHLIKTGPTGTNVNDLAIALAY